MSFCFVCVFSMIAIAKLQVPSNNLPPNSNRDNRFLHCVSARQTTSLNRPLHMHVQRAHALYLDSLLVPNYFLLQFAKTSHLPPPATAAAENLTAKSAKSGQKHSASPCPRPRLQGERLKESQMHMQCTMPEITADFSGKLYTKLRDELGFENAKHQFLLFFKSI